MQQVPSDGSYFLDRKGCAIGKGCTASASDFGLVRQLRLDRNHEGSNVFLCKLHWDKEMQHRAWLNEQGIAEKWDVFDFFERDPSLEQPTESKNTVGTPLMEDDRRKMRIAKINITSVDATRFDLHIASEEDGTGSSVMYQKNFERAEIPTWMSEATKFARDVGRTDAVLCIFDTANDDIDLIIVRSDMVQEILTRLTSTWWKRVLKYE